MVRSRTDTTITGKKGFVPNQVQDIGKSRTLTSSILPNDTLLCLFPITPTSSVNSILLWTIAITVTFYDPSMEVKGEITVTIPELPGTITLAVLTTLATNPMAMSSIVTVQKLTEPKTSSETVTKTSLTTLRTILGCSLLL